MVPETFTVTVVPSRVVMVKVPLPTDFTVPIAAGGVPPLNGMSGCEAEPGALVVDVVVAPAREPVAIAPPATAKPNATAAAVVTRTPRRRFRPTSKKGSDAEPCVSACSSCPLMICSLFGGCFRRGAWGSQLSAACGSGKCSLRMHR